MCVKYLEKFRTKNFVFLSRSHLSHCTRKSSCVPFCVTKLSTFEVSLTSKKWGIENIATDNHNFTASTLGTLEVPTLPSTPNRVVVQVLHLFDWFLIPSERTSNGRKGIKSSLQSCFRSPFRFFCHHKSQSCGLFRRFLTAWGFWIWNQ